MNSVVLQSIAGNKSVFLELLNGVLSLTNSPTVCANLRKLSAATNEVSFMGRSGSPVGPELFPDLPANVSLLSAHGYLTVIDAITPQAKKGKLLANIKRLLTDQDSDLKKNGPLIQEFVADTRKAAKQPEFAKRLEGAALELRAIQKELDALGLRFETAIRDPASGKPPSMRGCQCTINGAPAPCRSCIIIVVVIIVIIILA